MEMEGEVMGSRWFFLPGSRCTDSKIPRRRGHAQFACKEKVEGWVSRNWTPAAGAWVEEQRRGKSRESSASALLHHLTPSIQLLPWPVLEKEG